MLFDVDVNGNVIEHECAEPRYKSDSSDDSHGMWYLHSMAHTSQGQTTC